MIHVRAIDVSVGRLQIDRRAAVAARPPAIMELSPEDRRDREKVNEAVRRYRESRKCST
jgi:hypothetical protein